MAILASVGYLTSGEYAAFQADFLQGLATVNNPRGSAWNGDPASGAAQNVKIVKALQTVVRDDGSERSLVAREISGDPPLSYSATRSG